MTPEQRRARGGAAKMLLEDPVLQEGWALIEKELIEEWSRPQPFDAPQAIQHREMIYRQVQLLRKLREKLALFAGQAPR